MSGMPMATRVPWLLTALLLAFVVAQLVFMLKTRIGLRMEEAFLAAGSAFAGTLAMALAVLAMMTGP